MRVTVIVGLFSEGKRRPKTLDVGLSLLRERFRHECCITQTLYLFGFQKYDKEVIVVVEFCGY